MNGAIEIVDPALIALISSSFSGEGIVKPFVKEIFLVEFNIAGTSHLDLGKIEPLLQVNDVLHFFREPDNQFDPLAIKIISSRGEKLGYISRDKNEVLARLMDGGKLLFGMITKKLWHDAWLKITLNCFMRDY